LNYFATKRSEARRNEFIVILAKSIYFLLAVWYKKKKMFSCFFKHSHTYVDNPQLRPFKPQFDALFLSPHEVGSLYEVFRSCDVDASGHISVQELFAHLATEATFFRDRVFNLFDEDGSGIIDFREFVLSLWNYCTLSKASLVIFAFDLYDVDSTGCLSPKEMENMLRDLYGNQADKHPQAKIINKELKALDSVTAINVDRFRAFVANHPALLFPAFQMQLALRQHILGVRFWNRCADKRIQLVDGRRVALSDLTELNIYESAYLEVLDAREKAMIEEEKRRKREELARYSLIGWISNKFQSKRSASGKVAADEKQPGESTSTAISSQESMHIPALIHKPILHPKDEMAMLIIQATGTHHYRKAAAEHRHQQQELARERLGNHPLGIISGEINVMEEQYETDVGQQYLLDIDRHAKHNANDLAMLHLHQTPTQLQRDHKFVGNYNMSVRDKEKLAKQLALKKKLDEERGDSPLATKKMEDTLSIDPHALPEMERTTKQQRHNLGTFERTMELVHHQQQHHQPQGRLSPRPTSGVAKHASSLVSVPGDPPATAATTTVTTPPVPATRFLGEITGKPVLSPRPTPRGGSGVGTPGTGSHGPTHGHGRAHMNGGGGSMGGKGSRPLSPMISPRNPSSATATGGHQHHQHQHHHRHHDQGLSPRR
jgi:Ca2+-binding EF-hand superfamily protein